MSNSNKAVMILFFILCIMLLSVFDIKASFQNLQVGDQLPQLQGNDIISQENISTDKFLQADKIILICFWAEWSDRSIEQLQFLDELATQTNDSSIQFLSIYTGRLNTFKLNEFIKKRNISLPVLLDNNNMIAHAYGLIAVPSTIITNNQGIIKFLFSGFSLTAQDRLTDSLNFLLGKSTAKRVSPPDDKYKPNKKALHFYNTAFKLFGQRAYEQALTNLEKAQSYDSLYIQPYILQSVILYNIEQYEKAMIQCEILKQLDSSLLFPQLLLSKNLIRKENFDEAIINLNNILAADSTYLDVHFLLVRCFTEVQIFDKAQDHLNFILLHYSNHPKALFQQAVIHTLLEDKKSAIQSFIASGKIIFP